MWGKDHTQHLECWDMDEGQTSNSTQHSTDRVQESSRITESMWLHAEIHIVFPCCIK